MLSFALLSAVALQPAADSPAMQAPQFPSKVELVVTELMVVDASGRPIRDLEARDFELEVEGQERRIVNAEFVAVAAEPEAARASDSEAGFSSNEGLLPGRLVLLVVDASSIERFAGRETMQAAARVLGGLAPNDRVGLVTIPTSGPREEFTTDHRRVARALDRIVGQSGVVGRAALSQMLERPRRPVPTDDADAAALAQAADTGAWAFAFEYESEAARSRAVLRAAFEALQPLPGRKVMILVSQGLGLPETLSQPGAGGVELRELMAAAESARVAFYVVPVGNRSPLPSIESDLGPVTLAMDRQLHFSGLAMLADDAGGTVFRGEPERAFERVLRETSGYYRLGFEPAAGDLSRKARRIRVRVRREGALVRAPAREVLRPLASERQKKDELVAALRSPALAAELSVRAATWSLAAAESGRVRVLIGAEIGREASRSGLVVGYVLRDAAGRVAASASQPLRDGAPASAGPLPYSATVAVPPGSYVLRVAVRDGRGRLGSVDHRVEAGLVAAGSLALSDLLLGGVPQAGRPFRPAVVPEAGKGDLLFRGEVYGEEGPALDSATATLELVPREAGPPRVLPARLLPGGGSGRRIVQVALPVGSLEPGRYLARVTLTVEGSTRATVERPFRVTTP